MVFDLEGTDSLARKEFAGIKNLEKKNALFALAISQILVVNIRADGIGTKAASMIEVLRAILKISLRIINPNVKKRILLVFRDMEDRHNGEMMKNFLYNELRDAWARMSFEQTVEIGQMDDFFEFYHHDIRNINEPQRFEEDIGDLRDKLLNSTRSNYLFRNIVSDIPLNGFQAYLESIWGQTANELDDLNIPTQKELLANHRCEKFRDKAFKMFMEEIPAGVGTTEIVNFKEMLEQSWRKSLENYDQDAKNYKRDYYLKYWQELTQMILDECAKLSGAHILYIFKKCKKEFKEKLKSIKSKDNFEKEIENNKKQAIEKFVKTCEISIVKGNDPSISAVHLKNLRKYLTKTATAAIEKIKLEIERNKLEKRINDLSQKQQDNKVEAEREIQRLKNTITRLTVRLDQDPYDNFPLGYIICPYNSVELPVGWYECNGQSVRRAECTNFWDRVGLWWVNIYGAISSETFNLPDFRGRTIIVGSQTVLGSYDLDTATVGGLNGTKLKLGGTLGEKEVTLTLNQIPSHNHHINGLGNYGTHGRVGNAGELMWNHSVPGTCYSEKYTDYAGGSTPHTNIQPSIVMRAITRLK